MEPSTIERKDIWGGDSIEKAWWPEIKDKFPYYEKFWSMLVVPLSDRPKSIHLKPGVSEEWELFAEQHYAVFCHIAAAHDRVNELQKKSTILAFEEVYSHLASTLDIVEAFFCTIEWLLDGEKASLPIEVSSAESFSKFLEEWAKTEYAKKLLTSFKNQNKVFAFNPFQKLGKSRFNKLVNNDEKLWKEFANVSQRIRFMRNRFIHDCPKAKIISEAGTRLFPKNEDVFKKYERWSDMRKATTEETSTENEFMEVYEMASNDISNQTKVFNLIWEAILNENGQKLLILLKDESNRIGSSSSSLQEMDPRDMKHSGDYSTHGNQEFIGS
ncbi:hypothetical protein ACFL54_04160 [Planctomycetota bacterium]